MTDPNKPERMVQLAKKWQDGTITESEKNEFSAWYGSFEDVFEMNTEETRTQLEERLYQAIVSKGNITPHKSVSIWSRRFIGTAAAILLVLGVGLYFYSSKYQDSSIRTESLVNSKNDIPPGGNKAILTLADGQQISLAEALNGKLAEQAGITIQKTKDGQLVYKVSPDALRTDRLKGARNFIETPRGGTYQLTLSDGTLVVLNASSILKFPASFAGLKERRVELTGEAYFDVKHDAKQPFRVQTNDQVVEDIGTAFNVNSYINEVTKTTLIEGSAKVISLSSHVILIPGQQSTLQEGNLKISNADTEEAVAWKNGYFKFHEDLKSIMDKVSRWYDVEVIYQMQPDPSLAFGAKISRSRSLADVLKIIESAGDVHFKIEGRRVTVMK